MKCPGCKASIEDGVTFCGNCKTNIVWRNGKPEVSMTQAVATAGFALGGLVVMLPLVILLALVLWSCVR